MKVLMSAYACEPNRGSEPGIGWNWAVQASRNHEVWVLTRVEHPGVIEDELKRNPRPDLHFVFHELPWWTEWWTKSSIGFQLHYFIWQLTAVWVVKSLHRQIGFDLTHHVTWGTIRFLSPLAWLDIPFIWGPIAGGEEAPRGMLSTISRRPRLWEELRVLSNRLFRWDPLVRYTAIQAAAIVAVTDDTVLRLRKPERQKTHIIPAMAIDEYLSASFFDKARVIGREKADRPLQLIFVGRLLDWKGVHLGLHAISVAKSRGFPVEFTVLGDGPARVRLENLCTSLGLQEAVEFKGNTPRQQVLDVLLHSDAMMFPSLHDSGGFAVLEAMQAGLPVICLDLGGPAVSVTDETGFKIPVRNPDQVISGLADAIVSLAEDPGLRSRMGQAGRARVESVFTWTNKGEEINALYQRVIRARE